MYTAQVDRVPSFSGVPTVDVWGGGEGLVDALAEEAERLGVEIQYDSELVGLIRGDDGIEAVERSEEHTSELQSLMRTSYAVFCLKKKNKNNNTNTNM